MSESPETAVDFGRSPFDFKTEEAFAILKFVGDQDPDLAKEFEKKIRPQITALSSDLILDLSECGFFHPIWARSLMQIATQIKKIQRRMRVVTKNPAHLAFLQDQGVAASFPIVSDMETARRELTEKKSAKLDVSFINPFLEGAVEVLKRQAGMTTKAGAPGTLEAHAPLAGDISGVIPLHSESFMGSVIFTFPEPTYLKIISRMLGEEHVAITPENRDGVSELTNIIFGYAKRVLTDKGHTIKMALPKVVTGKNPSDLPTATGPRIAVPFESDAGPFSIEIRVQVV
jgi:chemotaxis protein CheX